MRFAQYTIVFFDGYCVLCNRSVQWLLHVDKNKVFYFASLQSDVSKDVLLHSGIDFIKKDSVILYHQKKFFVEAKAVQMILILLGYPYKLLGKFLFLIPLNFQNTIYRIIAKNRYRWFGHYTNCKIPSESLKNRILY